MYFNHLKQIKFIFASKLQALLFKNKLKQKLMIKPITLLLSAFAVLTCTSAFSQSIPALPQMVVVEGGSFTLGCGDKDSPCDKDEAPAHTVKINTFMMSKYEVSTYEWKLFAAEQKLPLTPTTWKEKGNLPITNVNWNQAIAFCNWLSKKQKLTPVYVKVGENYECNFEANGYRLPTEAEWEYAARGGKKSKGYKFSGANDMASVAWTKTNSNGMPHAYGTKLPNELGIFDMTGNVWEWCWDWHNADFYKMPNNSNNPRGPVNGDKKIVRGGSWDSVVSYSRLSNRISSTPETSYAFYGMRLVRSK